jgi:hypothetical protein
MSKDIASLAQTLGTVAKFTRVMQSAGLPDGFYQSVIDEPGLRSEIVNLSKRTTPERQPQEELEELFQQVESKIAVLGIDVSEAAEKHHVEFRQTFRGNYVEYHKSRHVSLGPVILYWKIRIIADSPDVVGEVSVGIWLGQSDGPGYWLDFRPGAEAADLYTEHLYYHNECHEFTRDELWFRGHCLVMDAELRDHAKHDDGEGIVLADEAWDFYIPNMVETFRSCAGYFDREREEGEVACPKCGGPASHVEGTSLHECRAGCTYPESPDDDGFINRLRFKFNSRGIPRQV